MVKAITKTRGRLLGYGMSARNERQKHERVPPSPAAEVSMYTGNQTHPSTAARLASQPPSVSFASFPPDASEALTDYEPEARTRHDVLDLLCGQHHPRRPPHLRSARAVLPTRARPELLLSTAPGRLGHYFRCGPRDARGRDYPAPQRDTLDLDVRQRERHLEQRDDLRVVRCRHDGRDLHPKALRLWLLIRERRTRRRRLGVPARVRMQPPHNECACPRCLRVLRIRLVAAVILVLLRVRLRCRDARPRRYRACRVQRWAPALPLRSPPRLARLRDQPGRRHWRGGCHRRQGLSQVGR